MKRFFALVLTIAIMACTLSSCVETPVEKTDSYGTGACVLATERDTSKNNVGYIEICVENYGKMVLLLDATAAPKTVVNFIGLVKAGFYGTEEADEHIYADTFHLVHPGWVLQGGCPNADGSGGLETTVDGEFLDNGWTKNDITHKRGVISMVRGNEHNSASCQFFICDADLPQLDRQYSSFGYIIQGMSVLDEIMEDYADLGNPDMAYIIEDKANQPVIKYIKWLPDEDGYWASKHS